MKSILVLHGPNLNMLGEREPETYGSESLADIVQAMNMLAERNGHTLTSFQSNAEHELIDKIQQAKADKVDVIIINPAALAHTSIALRDALLTVQIPFYEVHISNVYAREPFRQHSYLTDIATGVITGCGPFGYQLALQAAIANNSTLTGGE